MQKQFDTDNEEDMDLLWSILPTNTFKIRGMNGQSTYLFEDDNKCYGSISEDIININWHDKTEITRPVNYEDMIGCVGWFWGNYEEEKSLGILTEYRSEIEFHFVKGNNDNVYSHFRPAKKSELKFWEENDE